MRDRKFKCSARLTAFVFSGKVNKAFHAAEEGKSKSVSNAAAPGGAKGGDKWVSNYVPYGEYPKGESRAEDEVDATKDAAWKKNYVAYEEDKEADNKEKE